MLFNPQPTTQPVDNYALTVPLCGACGLKDQCETPKMPHSGEGRRRVLVIAEAPGEQEDVQGTQLVGKAGQLLRKTLEGFNVNLDRDCWKTNALICRPPGNRNPKDDEINYCRPNLLKTIKELDPDVIIPLGGYAVKSLIGYVWREDPGGVNLWSGWKIPDRTFNAWICPTYHPSFLGHMENSQNHAVLKRMWRWHLGDALELRGKPYPDGKPERYKIRLVNDPHKAADILRGWQQQGGAVAFDYETNRLSPYHEDSEIVSCGVCWRGLETIAYPWEGEAIAATRDLLASPCPKIGANTKFEDQWTKKHLGIWVNNWRRDTMLDAHVHDNRPGITSVKFQAYARLGLRDWSRKVEPYLKGGDATGKNRIRELDVRDLLYYNGMDAAVEYDLAVKQREELRQWKEN